LLLLADVWPRAIAERAAPFVARWLNTPVASVALKGRFIHHGSCLPRLRRARRGL